MVLELSYANELDSYNKLYETPSNSRCCDDRSGMLRFNECYSKPWWKLRVKDSAGAKNVISAMQAQSEYNRVTLRENLLKGDLLFREELSTFSVTKDHIDQSPLSINNLIFLARCWAYRTRTHGWGVFAIFLDLFSFFVHGLFASAP